jgi:hypothetical protein
MDTQQCEWMALAHFRLRRSHHAGVDQPRPDSGTVGARLVRARLEDRFPRAVARTGRNLLAGDGLIPTQASPASRLLQEANSQPR